MKDYRQTNKADFCTSYTSLFHTKGICKAGINVRELVGGDPVGWLMRSPCIQANQCETPCDKFNVLTPEDIAKQEAEWQEVIDQLTTLSPIINRLKKEHKAGGPAVGITGCPKCKGRLHWNVCAYNGHMHMKCETENCIVMME